MCDELIIIDHSSTDNTKDVLTDVAKEMGNVVVLNQDSLFYPLRFYTRIVQTAYQRGATHVAILDADEIVSGNLIDLAQQATNLLATNETFEVPWIPISNGFNQRDITGPMSRHRTGFSFCVTADTNYIQLQDHEYALHRSRFPTNITSLKQLVTDSTDGGLMHLQYIDERRQRAKEVRWKMMEQLRWPGHHTANQLNHFYDFSLPRGQLVQVPEDWWKPYKQWMHYVELGVESQAEKEVKRLWIEYPGRFNGISTLGIV